MYSLGWTETESGECLECISQVSSSENEASAAVIDQRILSDDREVTRSSETGSTVGITESMGSFGGQSTMGLRRPRGDSGGKYDRSTEYTY